MNKDNLNELIALFEAEKGARDGIGFNMADFIIGKQTAAGSTAYKDYLNPSNPCGTVACIAGHAAMLAEPDMTVQALSAAGHSCSLPARTWLGLEYSESNKLFFAEHSGMSLSRITIEQAIIVLKNLRDTGKVDWSIFHILSR